MGPLVWQFPDDDMAVALAGPAAGAIGPVTFGIHLEIVDGGTRFITRRVWLLGIPLPLILAPSVLALETPGLGGWHAKVQLRFPLMGEMLGYEGEIHPLVAGSQD